MKPITNLNNVHSSIAENVGKHVQVRSNRGRNRVDVTEGVIAQAYPCVFLIEIDRKESETRMLKTITFSYADILTKDVEVVFAS
jgi:uncharacterized protein Veg